MHPAPPHILVAQDDLVGDEAFLADFDEIVASREIGRDFGVLADLGPHQAVPGPHVDGGEQGGQHFQRDFGGKADHPFAEVEPAMHGIAAFLHHRQDDPARGGDETHRDQHHDEGRRPGHDRDREQVEEAVVSRQPQPVVELVENPEGGEDRQQADRRNHQQHDDVESALEQAQRQRSGWRGLERGEIDHAGLAARRAVPDFALPDACAGLDRGQVLQLGPVGDVDIVLDDAGRSQRAIRADVDAPDDQLAALDPGIGHDDAAAQTRACADADQIGRAHVQFADDAVGRDFRAQRIQQQRHDRRGLEPFDVGQVEDALGEPPAEVIDAPERIAPRLGAPQQQPFHADCEDDGDDIDADIDAQQRRHFLEDVRFRIRQQHVADEDAEPLRRHQAQNQRQHRRLRKAAEEAPQ